MDIRALIEQMIQDAAFRRVMNNPLAQFGVPARQYLGATLLPERNVPENAYTEENIRYRTVIANDGTRYSPVQRKRGVLIGSLNVQLGYSDIGSDFSGQDYDALVRILQRYAPMIGGGPGAVGVPPMAAMTAMLNWADLTLNRPLLEKNEKQRWEAIVNAQVVRTGDNGYRETVTLPNPTGHRVTAGGTWSNAAYDPYLDIIAGAQFLRAKGFEVNRMISSITVQTILSNNAKIQQRNGLVSIQLGTTVGLRGRVTPAVLNDMFLGDQLPALERYDLQYRTQTGSGYFLPRDCFILVCTTGRDETIDRADLEPITIQNTIGYTAVGRPAGQEGPGRVMFVNPRLTTKPPRIAGEAWQASWPVVAEPEAFYVISGIA